MLVWCGLLFALGILAFMDSLFNYGDIFRQVNSVLFMLVSLGLLIRITTKIKLRNVEGYMERIKQLEDELKTVREPAGRSKRRESVSA